MAKETEEGKLAKWCAERNIYSKADLMRYGCDNYYLRAWRTGCDFVTDGRARKLTKQECIDRNLTTSMGWYIWLSDEPAKDELSEAISQNNLAQETIINTKAVERPAFMERSGQLAFLG